MEGVILDYYSRVSIDKERSLSQLLVLKDHLLKYFSYRILILSTESSSIDPVLLLLTPTLQLFARILSPNAQRHAPGPTPQRHVLGSGQLNPLRETVESGGVTELPSRAGSHGALSDEASVETNGRVPMDRTPTMLKRVGLPGISRDCCTGRENDVHGNFGGV